MEKDSQVDVLGDGSTVKIKTHNSNNQTPIPKVNIPIRAPKAVVRKKPLSVIGSLFSDHRVVAIVGNSALGKTEIAKQYAEDHSQHYYHVWFVDAESWETDYRNLAKEWKLFQLKDIDLLPIDVIVHAIHSELGNGKMKRNQKSLIVFDNAPSRFIGERLKGQLPSNTDILITSKTAEWETKVDLSKDEYQLTHEEGLEILRNWISQNKYYDEAAHAIVNTFSNLPVVIAQAGNFIANSRFITMANYLKEFTKNKKEILSQGKLKNPQEKGYIDVYTSVKMKLNEIAEMEPKALELLRYCAYLPAKNIPGEFLLKLFGSESLLLDRCLDTIGTLVIDNQNTVTIHELFQEIIVEESQSFADQVLTKLAQPSLDFTEFLSTNPKKAVVIYQHGLREADYKHDENNIERFASKSADAYSRLGQQDLAQRMNEKVLEISYKRQDIDSVVKYSNRIAKNYYHKGDYAESQTLFRKALEMMKQTGSNKNDAMLADCLNGLGLNLFKVGDFESSFEFYQEALIIRQKIFGEDHPETARTYNNIGLNCSKRGEHARGLEYCQKALVIREKFGKEHFDTAASYNDVGLIMSYINPEEGYQYCAKAHAIFYKAFGDDHPETAKSYHNIGICLTNLGTNEEALKKLEKSLEIRKKVLAQNHLDTAESYYNAGNLLCKLNQKKPGLEYLNKALMIRTHILGPQNIALDEVHEAISNCQNMN